MAYYKGFGYLVDAARSLPDDVRVIIGGCGEMAVELQARIASAGLADKVQLAGKISVAELGAYFELADVFCLPSIARSEAFGVVLLEAMACGTPIIAANIPGSGVPWVNADGISGFNVAPENAAALAAALLRVLDNRELRDELGRRARQRFAENFTAERMVAATRQLYQNLCAP
jgi:rhamnosyl/mannosyltransferase